MFGFASKSNSKNTTATGAASLTVEPLEDRVVQSSYAVSGGTLWITGGEGADNVRVDTRVVGWTWTGWIPTPVNVVQISENGRPTASFWESDFNGYGILQDIVFQGFGGDDTFVNNTGLSLWASGGEGEDKLFGGWGNDALFGDGGYDELHGNAGDDVLDGGLYDWVADYEAGGTGRDSFATAGWWGQFFTVTDTYADFNSYYDQTYVG